MTGKYFSSIGFSLCSLFFVVFILLMYVNKKKYKNIENSLFITLLILSFCCIFSEFAYVYILSIEDFRDIIKEIACKTYLVFMVSWIQVFGAYILALLTKNKDVEIKNKRRRSIFPIVIIIEIIAIALVCILDIVPNSRDASIYNFVGNATYVAYALGAVDILLAMYLVLFKSDIVSKEQKGILSLAIIFVSASLACQAIFPVMDYNIQNFQFTLLLLALFFTLENQDNKLLVEHAEQKNQADEANREQTEFLTSMSHEIRTPMNTIIGFSEALIREGATNEQAVRSDVANIHSAAISLLDLINNILDLSRIESQQEKIVEKEFNLVDVAIELDNDIKNKTENKEIKYDLIIDPNLPQSMMGDHVKVNKIISNLIANIISYTSSGSVSIKVGFAKIEDVDCKLYFDITSMGSEIPLDEYNKYYLNDSEDNRVNTYVLELYVAKLFAKMLETEVVITSTDRFNIGYRIEIPLQITNPTPIGDISNLLGQKQQIKDIFFENKKALIVDDNTINIKLIERFLVELKMNVEYVTSGSACIEKIKENDYDIIFLDHMMPIMDGVQTLSKMKDIKEFIPPVIALTANVYAGVKDFYLNNGFSDYLPKPVNRGELINILSNYL